MNFLIFSDSHRNVQFLNEAIRRSHNTDAILFLGDGSGDLGYESRYMDIPVYSVLGNCDLFSLFQQNTPKKELLLHFDEYTVLMIHGHLYGVKSSYEAAAAHAARLGADILLFGHTHKPLEKRLTEGEEIGGVILKKPLYIFNPGSIGQRGEDGHYSFGTLTLSKKGILFGHGKI